MNRVVVAVFAVGIALITMFRVSERNVDELRHYTQAAADTTVEELVEQIPTEVHERKLDQDLSRLRQELIDHSIQLARSNTLIEKISDDVRQHKANLDRRGRLLAQAFPVLETAHCGDLRRVEFAGTTRATSEFESEIDRMLDMQNHETEQLVLKQQGLERLAQSSAEAEAALTQLREALESAEHEVATLRLRREQAEIESRTLELTVAISTESGAAKVAIGRGLERLRDDVRGLEAANDVIRALMPAAQTDIEREMSRDWERIHVLEEMYHRESGAGDSGEDESSARLNTQTNTKD